MKLRIKAFDLMNACLIPTFKDETGATPADCWDFTNRRHLLDHYGSITLPEIKQWGDDCVRWGITGFEVQDQEWLLSLARNSSTTDLQVKVNRRFDKLDGEFQCGVVYIWMMLDTIVNITDDVAAALQKKIKSFADKGLRGVVGENVETACVEVMAVCTRLAEKDLLPKDSVNDIITGLSKCTHKGFSKIFEDFKTSRSNSLMSNVALPGTVLEQINLIFEEALSQYASFSLSSEWNATRHSAHNANVKGVACDNCLGPHYIRDCTSDKDEVAIARNRKARQQRQSSGGGRGGRGGRGGCGGRGGRGGRGDNNNNKNAHGYGRGKFGKPYEGETVRKIGGKAYCACKTCGWNKGSTAHTTKAHADAQYPESYVMRPSLKREMSQVSGADDSDDESKGAASVTSLTSLVSACTLYERETEDPDQSAFAGNLKKLLSALAKE